MRKLISVFFIVSVGLCALSACGVKRPLYKAPEQQNVDVEQPQQQPQDQQEK